MSGTDALPVKTDFAVLWRITTRWEEEDVYGHVNDVVCNSYFDTAVNGYLMQATGTDIWKLDAYGVVVETGCRFLRELRFPDDVEAGLRVTRLGTSSVVYEIALVQGESDEPAAVGRFVHVYVAGAERIVAPVPALVRAVLEPPDVCTTLSVEPIGADLGVRHATPLSIFAEWDLLGGSDLGLARGPGLLNGVGCRPDRDELPRRTRGGRRGEARWFERHRSRAADVQSPAGVSSPLGYGTTGQRTAICSDLL